MKRLEKQETTKSTKSMKSPYTTTYTSTSESKTETDLKKSPPTNTPHYYVGKYKGLEAFDIVMDFQRDSYNLGVAIAYLLRAGKKQGNPRSQDIAKAIDHLNKELEYERDYRPAAEVTEDGQP